MIEEFEIMKVTDIHNRGQFIFVRQINVGHNFEIKKGSMLEDIPLNQYLDMPRKIDENGEQRMDVFIFRPAEKIPPDYFTEGQIVKLVTAD